MIKKPEKFIGEDKISRIALIIFYILLAYLWLYIFAPRVIPYFLRIGIPSKPVNILVMGTDINYDGHRQTNGNNTRTDVLILISLNPFTSNVTMLSIPRDTMAKIPDYGFQKINSANTYGGEKLTIDTVEKFLNIHVDKYIKITPKTIVSLIDAMGGIRVYINKNMYYVDHAAKLNINLKEGWHKLSGDEAQGFIRFRHESLGDIARIQHQHEFMTSLSQQLASPVTLFRMPWLIPTAFGIKTNLGFLDKLTVVNMLRMTGKNRMNMILLPGDFSENYWVADRDKTKFIVEKYFTWPSKRNKASYVPNIAIINGSGNDGNTDKVLRKLKSKESAYFLCSIQNISNDDYSKTRVIAQKGDQSGAKKIASEIGIRKVEVSSIGDIRSDFTIVIGKDFR